MSVSSYSYSSQSSGFLMSEGIASIWGPPMVNCSYEAIDRVSIHSSNSSSSSRSSSASSDASDPGTKSTVMMRNIPNKYTLDMLREELCQFWNINFIHLPMTKRKGNNFGYALVNFESAAEAEMCMDLFQGYAWEHFNSGKLSQIIWAERQGYAANVAEYCNPRKFRNVERLPWVKWM